MGGRMRLQYVHSYTDRLGKRRHYFRRHGKKHPLPGAFGSTEFMAEYGRLLAAGEEPAPEPKARPAPRSFAAVAEAYFASGIYRTKAESTRVNYRRVIERFLADHGHRLVHQMKREHVDRLMGELADKPGAAHVFLKRLRTLTRYAIKLGWITTDPTAGVDVPKTNERHTWTEQEVARFEAFWAVGTKQRLAEALLVFTGQRGGDARLMNEADIAGGEIAVAQEKTGAKVTIPMHPELQRVLAATPAAKVRSIKAAGMLLVTDYGQPFTRKGFQNFVASAIRAAGLPERCKTHGLRKAAARRLAEAGCTTKEIMAITGHKTLAEVERYTRAAEQKRMARAAVAKQVMNEGVANRGGELATRTPQTIGDVDVE